MKYDKQRRLYYRSDGELGVAKEQDRTWRTMVEHDLHNKSVLDLGGHIGTFVWYMANKGNAKHVVSVEPDPGNIEVFKRNFPDSKLIEAAVVDDKTIKTTKLYLGKKYTSTHSVEPFRGRKVVVVKTVQWETLLCLRRWAGIKCDIEGAEYILDWSKLPDCVQVIAFEFHYFRPDWKIKQEAIHRTLLRLGFEAIKPPKYNSYSRVCIAHYRRL